MKVIRHFVRIVNENFSFLIMLKHSEQEQRYVLYMSEFVNGNEQNQITKYFDEHRWIDALSAFHKVIQLAETANTTLEIAV